MKQIVSVPHSEIKAHLDKEKEAKKLKRTRKSGYAAFRSLAEFALLEVEAPQFGPIEAPE